MREKVERGDERGGRWRDIQIGREEQRKRWGIKRWGVGEIGNEGEKNMHTCMNAHQTYLTRHSYSKS